MSAQVYRSFFSKVAEMITPSKKEWKAKLQPGDIFITTHGRPDALGDRLFQSVSKRLQGEISHAGIYVGDNKVVEMSNKMHHRGIDGQLAGRDAWIVRPKLPKADRLAAAARAKEIAKAEKPRADYASLPFLLKTVAEAAVDKRLFADQGEREIEKKRYICSNLVTHTYKDKVDFVPGKGRGYVIPKDLLTSPKVTRIARFVN
ncbi:MAG: hypothetical protein ACO32I_04820, partial [Candidatus Limnocylindrus sp.]